MNHSELIARYWNAWRVAIENHYAAVLKNENVRLIHCLERVIYVRESEFYRIQKGA